MTSSETATPQQPPRTWFIDAHCDAAMKAVDAGADLVNGGKGLHVSLSGLLEADVRVQVFASCAVYPDTPAERLAARGEAMLDAVVDAVAKSAGRAFLAKTAGDVEQARAGGPVAALLALEGADALGEDPGELRRFVEKGVRMLSFAWKDNAFSGTAFGAGGGLTARGEWLLGSAEEMGVLIDVSHLSDRAFLDVVGLATKPFVASHSNCRALCPHPRNLTDAMIRQIADAGGVVGINLAPHFLDAETAAAYGALRAEVLAQGDTPAARAAAAERRQRLPRPSLDLAGAHISHAIKVGGEDAVGIGGDLDGIEETPLGISSVRNYVRFPDVLARAGLSLRQIEKVAHANLARVLCDTLPR